MPPVPGPASLEQLSDQEPAEAWPGLPASLPVAAGHVHVARADVAAAASAADTLPADERARAQRFRRSEPRARYLAGRVLLRELLRRCPDAAQDAPLTPSAQGKPRLHGAGSPGFSISHAGDVVLVALGRGEVGVDVEAPRPHLDGLALARRLLPPHDAQHLAAVPADSRPGAFLVLWTRHEAALKCRGVGLGGAPSAAEGLVIRSFALPGGYTGAIAAAAPFALSRWSWRP